MTGEEVRRLEDAVALERFEALVFSQQPATQPWTPVTDYSFEARKQIEGRHPQLIKEVFQPTRVLDCGCGPGHLVRLLHELGVGAAGFDKALQVTPFVMQADVAAPSLIDGIRTRERVADLVVCREVLEHLTIRDVREAARNLCRLSSRFVYVTTRFARNPTHLLDVDTSDDLDPTHITMLNQSLLRTLFVLEGFRRRADLEAKLDWQFKNRVLVYERV